MYLWHAELLAIRAQYIYFTGELKMRQQPRFTSSVPGSQVHFTAILFLHATMTENSGNPIAPLRRLTSIILSSIESLEHRFSVSSIDFPSLDEPFDPSSKAEEVLLEPDMMMNVSFIVAAASQVSLWKHRHIIRFR